VKRKDFYFIIEKMQFILAFRKNRLLNKSGRLTLASSILSSISSYYMQTSWLPQFICENIDQTTRNFSWRGLNEKDIHLVGWSKIARPELLGGLDIKLAREANVCLVGKLVWDLVQSFEKLWVNPLSNKYASGHKVLQANASLSSFPIWSSVIKAKKCPKRSVFFVWGLRIFVLLVHQLDHSRHSWVSCPLYWYPWPAAHCQRCSLCKWSAHEYSLYQPISCGLWSHKPHSY